MTTAQRNVPTGTCPWCCVPLFLGAATCASCRSIETIPEPGPKDALTGGSWRFDPFRRVQVWVAA